jgi:hypothetical protein
MGDAQPQRFCPTKVFVAQPNLNRRFTGGLSQALLDIGLGSFTWWGAIMTKSKAGFPGTQVSVLPIT